MIGKIKYNKWYVFSVSVGGAFMFDDDTSLHYVADVFSSL